MHRLINTIAMCAAVAALMAGLWQDWSVLTTVKRMLIGYLGFFFLGSLMVLTIRAVPIFDKVPIEPDEKDDQNKTSRAAKRVPENV